VIRIRETSRRGVFELVAASSALADGDPADGTAVFSGFTSRDEASSWARIRGLQLTGAKPAKAKRAKRPAKENPQLLTIGNPSTVTARELQQARAAYKRFHGIDPPPKCVHVGDGKGVLIGLGEIKRIDYGPRRGRRKGPIWYHHFAPGAVLASSPDGRRLVILDPKGKLLVDWDRGIVR
jgi:hypothetical protein